MSTGALTAGGVSLSSCWFPQLLGLWHSFQDTPATQDPERTSLAMDVLQGHHAVPISWPSPCHLASLHCHVHCWPLGKDPWTVHISTHNQGDSETWPSARSRESLPAHQHSVPPLFFHCHRRNLTSRVWSSVFCIMTQTSFLDAFPMFSASRVSSSL